MIIKQNRSKAIYYYLPLIITFTTVAILSLIFTSEPIYTSLGYSEEQIGFINLAIFTYGLPLCLFVSTIYATHKGFSIYKYKHTPPMNLPVFKNTESKPVKCPLCLYILSLLFLLFSIYMVYYGHNVFIDIFTSKGT